MFKMFILYRLSTKKKELLTILLNISNRVLKYNIFMIYEVII